MNIKKVLSFLFILCMCTVQQSFAQGEEQQEIIMPASGSLRPIHYRDINTYTNKMELYEDSLMYFIDSVYQSLQFEERQSGNEGFVKIMRRMFTQQNSYNYPFDSLKTRVNIITPADNSFKIFNWEIVLKNGLIRYFGVILKPDGKYYPLIDVSGQVYRQKEDTILNNSRWYGANYYRLMEKPVKGNKLYFLLGYNGGNDISDFKIMECLTFDNEGKPQFGAPVFQSMVAEQAKTCNRFIAEVQKGNKITMNYNPEVDLIVYDHLESSIGDKNRRNTFISDGSYDGLKWVGNGWQIVYNTVPIVDLGDGAAPGLDGAAGPDKKDLNFSDRVNVDGKPIKKKKK